jgi:hypothetical protein
MIDDGERQADPKTKLVLHLKINDSQLVDCAMEAFGYSELFNEEEGDNGTYVKYPFVLKYERGHKVPGRISYEGWDYDTEDRINIHAKTIQEGETFTFFQISNEGYETVYRIASVHPLS